MKRVVQVILAAILACVFLYASTNEEKISTWNALIAAYETNINEIGRLRPLLIEELEHPHTRSIETVRQLEVTDRSWKQLHKRWKKFKEAME